MTGEVIRWNKDFGPEKVDAVKYIECLEAEIEELNRQVAGRSANGQNELLDYLKSLEPQNIKVLYYYVFMNFWITCAPECMAQMWDIDKRRHSGMWMRLKNVEYVCICAHAHTPLCL